MKKNPLIIPADHKPPTSRRDFLRYGVIPFAGAILLPKVSWGALACETSVDPGYIPFLVFDMAGGAALPGNFLVGQAGGPDDLCSDYSMLGWNPRRSGALDRQFGAPMARNESKVLAGILANTSIAARANLRIGTLCHFSQDDTASNTTSALHLIARAGLKGRYLKSGVGSEASLSGGNSAAAMSSPAYTPLLVKNETSLQEALSNGPAFAEASSDENNLLRRAILDLSLKKLKRAGRTALDCAFQESLSYGTRIEALEASKNVEAAAVYQLAESRAVGNTAFASIAYNVLQGNTGPGVISIGGFDYHDGTQTTGDTKDQEMGVQIGRAIELAHRLKKPLFFQLITDGGVSSDPGSRNWRSDSNVRSLTVIGFYDPKGAPSQRRLQVGEYTASGIVNQEHPLLGGGGDSAPAKAADVVLANYLAACGKIGGYEAAGGMLRGSDVDSALIFG